MRRVLAMLRRLAQLPGFRHLRRVRALTRISAAARGSLVAEPLAFARNELRFKDSLATYHLPGRGVSVCLRHHTPDLMILDEVFAQRLYEPPKEVSLLLETPQGELRVVDLGANIGLFGAFVLERYPGANMTAFEPDRFNAEVLARCIEANNRSDSWKLVRACASTTDGRVRFRAGCFALSQAVSEADRVEGELVDALDVFPYLESVDLLKMDIEGSEWPILADPRFTELAPRCVVLEYHGQACPEPDAFRAVHDLMASAGYTVRELFHREDDDVGMLWGWRTDPPRR